MSGIFGIYHRDDRFIKREILIKMSNTLEHRGTDGSGLWCDGSVGLGNRLLYTTPESMLEQQPLVEQSGDYVITADTRLDNREELFSLLNLQETSSATLCDSQLILAAYKKWGQDCPQYLLGDFAFAIWDRRKQQLFCARDHFGVKPFYYFRSPRTFAWATEIKAIFCLPEVLPRLNEVKVADYLISLFEDKAITFYEDILRLPPAHSLIVNPTQIQLNKYWFLDANSELRLKSDQDFNPLLVERLNLQQRIQQLQPYRNSPAQTAKEAHYRRLNWGVIPFSLEVVDRAAAALGTAYKIYDTTCSLTLARNTGHEAPPRKLSFFVLIINVETKSVTRLVP